MTSSNSPATETEGAEHLEDDSTPAPTGPSLGERYEELERQYEEARELLEDYNRRAVDFVREHPGICIAGALGTGYILGRLASRRWLK